MALVLVWALWLRAWFGRIELVALAQPWVEPLGLTWLPEGWRAEVRAQGTLDARPVVLRWRWRWNGVQLAVKLGNSWKAVPVDGGPEGLRLVLEA